MSRTVRKWPVTKYRPDHAEITEYGFADAIVGREDQFPTLARAIANTVPAMTTTIEWLVRERDDKLETQTNYTQIVRTPYTPTDKSSIEKYLIEHLYACEQVLLNGEPRPFSRSPEGTGIIYATCGGVNHYLGRDLDDDDVIGLRPLRDLSFRPSVQYLHDPVVVHEWLSEFSLEVHP